MAPYLVRLSMTVKRHAAGVRLLPAGPRPAALRRTRRHAHARLRKVETERFPHELGPGAVLGLARAVNQLHHRGRERNRHRFRRARHLPVASNYRGPAPASKACRPTALALQRPLVSKIAPIAGGSSSFERFDNGARAEISGVARQRCRIDDLPEAGWRRDREHRPRDSKRSSLLWRARRPPHQ